MCSSAVQLGCCTVCSSTLKLGCCTVFYREVKLGVCTLCSSAVELGYFTVHGAVQCHAMKSCAFVFTNLNRFYRCLAALQDSIIE